MAKENIRMLCGLLSIFGFLTITVQNRKFSKNDKAAITPNIFSLAFSWEFSSLLPGFGVEMFLILENVAVLSGSRLFSQPYADLENFLNLI